MLTLRSRLTLGIVLVAAASSGCEIGRKTFHMDSNSPNPFFGIDLIPRRSTTSLQPSKDAVSVQLVREGDLPLESAIIR